jgi:membrane-associated phospholipid phosphatase
LCFPCRIVHFDYLALFSSMNQFYSFTLKYNAVILVTFFSIFSVTAQNPDIDLLRNINQNRNVSLDPAMIFISDSNYPFTIGVPAALLITSTLKKDKQFREKAVVVGVSQFSAAIITATLKYSINRQRPFEAYEGIENISVPHTSSFPSGHTSSSFALATSLSMNYREWYIAVPSFTYASAVAYSRLYMGVHYPSDILAGAVIGSGCSFLTYHANKKLRESNKPKDVNF